MARPLWTTSAFTFESTNYHLKQQVNGAKGIDLQICKKYLGKNLLKWRADKIHENSEIHRQYYKRLFTDYKHVSSAKIVGETVLLGNGRPTNNNVLMYERCIYKGDLYHTLLIIGQEKELMILLYNYIVMNMFK